MIYSFLKLNKHAFILNLVGVGNFNKAFLSLITQEKKSAIKWPDISNFFRQRSGFINDFTLISPEKKLADFRGFNSTNHMEYRDI